MKYSILYLSLLISGFSFGQAPPPPPGSYDASDSVMVSKAFKPIEKMPEFPGGDEALMKFLEKHIVYPALERESDIQGCVMVGFKVMEDGSLSSIAIKRGVSPGLDKEAYRVVKLLPKFKPGLREGKPVPVEYILPVTFQL